MSDADNCLFSLPEALALALALVLIPWPTRPTILLARSAPAVSEVPRAELTDPRTLAAFFSSVAASALLPLADAELLMDLTRELASALISDSDSCLFCLLPAAATPALMLLSTWETILLARSVPALSEVPRAELTDPRTLAAFFSSAAASALPPAADAEWLMELARELASPAKSLRLPLAEAEPLAGVVADTEAEAFSE